MIEAVLWKVYAFGIVYACGFQVGEFVGARRRWPVEPDERALEVIGGVAASVFWPPLAALWLVVRARRNFR